MSVANPSPTLIPSRYRCVGVNDEADACSHCGKTGLKRVAWLLDTEGADEAAPYGTTCAAYMLLGRKVSRARSETVVFRAAAESLEAKARDLAQPIRSAMDSATVPAPVLLRSKDGHAWWGADGVEVGTFGAFDDERRACFRDAWLKRKIALPMIRSLSVDNDLASAIRSELRI